MFGSGFAEDTRAEGPSTVVNDPARPSLTGITRASSIDKDDDMDGDDPDCHRFQDSDDEDDQDDVVMTDDTQLELRLPSSPTDNRSADALEQSRRDNESWDAMEDDKHEGASDSNGTVDYQTIIPSRGSQPGTPRGPTASLEMSSQGATVTDSTHSVKSVMTSTVPGPPKVRVVVSDAAYSTYRAVLYYVRRRFIGLL